MKTMFNISLLLLQQVCKNSVEFLLTCNIAKHTPVNKLHTTFRHIHIDVVCTMIKIAEGNNNINADSNNSN